MCLEMDESIFERAVKKIPGIIPVENKTEKQGYIGDLSSKNKLELLDLLSRQDNLLINKKFINKLPDKGERITRFKKEIVAEIQKRNEGDKLSEMLSKLNVSGKEGLESLEWSGKCAPGFQTGDKKEVGFEEDSDDESDPLKILAGHSGAGFHKKKLKVLKPEEPLIKPSDLIDAEEINPPKYDNNNTVVEDEYAKVLRSKLDAKSKRGKERFLPHRTINPSKSKNMNDRTKSKYWEVTAATPPLPVHGDTKLVSLEESIHLQYDQQQKLKETQLKHATERLASSGYLAIGGVAQNTTEYRDHDHAETSSSDDEISDHEAEVVDEDDHGGGGVVVYNIID